jgi:sec-independent protein translocase protein TatC
LREHRRHAVLIVLILAALLTPGPDVTSQFLLAAPAYLLFELSILLARVIEKNQKTT